MIQEGHSASNDHNNDALNQGNSLLPLEVSPMMTMHQCDCHPAFAPEGGVTDSTARLRQPPEPNNEGHKQDLNIYDKQ